MSFEEFFIKKKIDLDQLEKADPQLYREFREHFLLMGEKSFDHSKKFWFNKLRHLYHLQTPVKETVTQTESQIASQAEPLSSPTIEQQPSQIQSSEAAAMEEGTAASKAPAFKPRFKPRTAVSQAEESAKSEAAEPSASSPAGSAEQDALKPAKKPAFRPRNIKPVSGNPSEDAQKVESRPGQTEVSNTPLIEEGSSSQESPKPAYKPKFKVRNIPKNPSGAAEQTGSTVEQSAVAGSKTEEAAPAESTETKPSAKPGYKPKFNMKNIPAKASQDTVKEQASPEVTPAEPVAEQAGGKEDQPPAANEQGALADERAKPAYKPRFSMKTVSTKTPPEQAGDQEAANVLPSAEPAAEKELTATTSPDIQDKSEEEKPKPAYKPRFNMKNIKPKGE